MAIGISISNLKGYKCISHRQILCDKISRLSPLAYLDTLHGKRADDPYDPSQTGRRQQGLPHLVIGPGTAIEVFIVLTVKENFILTASRLNLHDSEIICPLTQSNALML